MTALYIIDYMQKHRVLKMDVGGMYKELLKKFTINVDTTVFPTNVDGWNIRVARLKPINIMDKYNLEYPAESIDYKVDTYYFTKYAYRRDIDFGSMFFYFSFAHDPIDNVLFVKKFGRMDYTQEFTIR